MSPEPAPLKTDDFSLVLGGPLYQLLVRGRLVRPPLDLLKRRILVISMAAWAPLLVLTILGGRFLGGVKVPFRNDFEVHVRLLLSVPLLILAEVTIHRRMKAIVGQFVRRQIISPPLQVRLGEIVQSALKLRNSAAVELALLALVLIGGGLWWNAFVSVKADTWYATVVNGQPMRTPAGIWYQFVSVPITQFILLRWYFRLVIWIRFLWQVSRLNLNLIPTHPDRSCGLGFLDGIVFAMAPFLLAQSCVVAGSLANRLVHEGTKLPDYYIEIGTLAAFLFLITLGPLCLFTPPILKARLLGLQVYGALASDYVRGFQSKWIGGQRPPDEELLGTGDIQSLADLANSFAVVQSIIPFPFGRSSLLGLAVIVALPLLPLTLTMLSPQELMLRLVKLVL